MEYRFIFIKMCFRIIFVEDKCLSVKDFCFNLKVNKNIFD